jgi:hypothetical protein
MGGAGRLGRVRGLGRLGRIALQRRDGPPAAVGGGQVVGGRHDSPRSEEEDGGSAACSPSITWPRRAGPSPSLPLPANVITHWARGRGEGDPGSFPPHTGKAAGLPGAPGRVRESRGPGPRPLGAHSRPVTCLRFHHYKRAGAFQPNRERPPRMTGRVDRSIPFNKE